MLIGGSGQFVVSIHAPVKVRLERLEAKITSCKVSIHAPVKVRLQDKLEDLENWQFQFTHL